MSEYFVCHKDAIITMVAVTKFNIPSMLLFGMQDGCALLQASPQNRFIHKQPAKTPLIT